MTDILEQIVADKREAVARLKEAKPLGSFINRLSDKRSPRFKGVLSSGDEVNVIAELKKRSPSKGILVPQYDPALLARRYAQGGACALSVLTEEKHFSGCAEHLEVAARESGLPVLCKDFIVDPYQLYYARLMDADAVLVIVGLHAAETLAELVTKAKETGLDCLVEVHDEKELRVALEAGAEIIGVNNRNLRDFSISFEVCEQLAASIPGDVVKVAESGIHGPDDIARLRKSGYHNFLIGEALVTSLDPVALLRSLRGL